MRNSLESSILKSPPAACLSAAWRSAAWKAPVSSCWARYPGVVMLAMLVASIRFRASVKARDFSRTENAPPLVTSVTNTVNPPRLRSNATGPTSGSQARSMPRGAGCFGA